MRSHLKNRNSCVIVFVVIFLAIFSCSEDKATIKYKNVNLHQVDSLSDYYYFYTEDSIFGRGLFVNGQPWGEWIFSDKCNVIRMNYHNGFINGIVRMESIGTDNFMWTEVKYDKINGYYIIFDGVIRYYGHYKSCKDSIQNHKQLVGIDTYSSKVSKIIILPLFDYFSGEEIGCE